MPSYNHLVLSVKHRHYWQHIPHIGMLLFILGLAGGIALRISIFMEPMGKFWVKFAWFMGIVAYTIFYGVRISIENHRREICETGLIARLKKNELSEGDVIFIHHMVLSHCRSKVKYNYIIWFVISIASLLAGIFSGSL